MVTHKIASFNSTPNVQSYYNNMKIFFKLKLPLIITSYILPSLCAGNSDPIIAYNYIYQPFPNTYLVNPSFIKVRKRINLQSINHILSTLQNISTTYSSFCERYKPKFVAKTVGNWVIINKSFQNRYKAQFFCKKTYFSNLIEIRNLKDLYQAYQVLQHNDQQAIANVVYDPKRKIFTYASDNENINSTKIGVNMEKNLESKGKAAWRKRIDRVLSTSVWKNDNGLWI